jgi:ribose/xylose/arabinose/galactoside ABC-type transport system permease subunit
MLFLLIVIALSIASPVFFSSRNLFNILRQTSVNGIIAVGMTFVIIAGGIDLSVGAIVALSAVVSASFGHHGQPVFLAFLAGIATGLACGAINGILVGRFGVASFIVTLGSMTILRGLSLVITQGKPVIDLSTEFAAVAGNYVFHVPVPVLIFVLVVLMGFFILGFTRYGRYVYGVGGNELAARVSGINSRFIIGFTFVISGVLAALAGVVLASRVQTGSPVAGIGYELDAIAAVVIGGTSLSGGVGSIFGTFVGCLIIGVMSNGLDLLNVTSYFQQIVKGVAIILVVLFDKRMNRVRS